MEITFQMDFVVTKKSADPNDNSDSGQTSFQTLKTEVETKTRPTILTASSEYYNLQNKGLDYDQQKSQVGHTEPYCSKEGAVVKDSGVAEKCTRCPVGTYYDKPTKNCVKCRQGTFQNKEGQFKCYECPEGTWTFGDDAKNFTSCRAMCGPGMFSSSGLARCSMCPLKTYSTGKMNTQCEICPEGTRTVLPGGTSVAACGMECAPGTYSANGVEPCTPCPKGTYQSESGMVSCTPCQGKSTTYGMGAESLSDCREIDQCVSQPCVNDGVCVSLKDTFKCKCPAGYAGTTCEKEINDCAVNPCSLNGTCVDKVGGYVCKCNDGYTGAHCQDKVSRCSPNPCRGGGQCTEDPSGFSCSCPDGLTGEFCEQKLDPCTPNPCQYSGICAMDGDEYKCFCRPGYTGINCQINQNDCASNPCQNDGVCVDGVGMFSCTCPAGFTGVRCEHKVNHCQSNPCQNGGKCVARFNDYRCSCKPTYSGKNCQTKLSSDFDVIIPYRMVSTYSRASVEIPSMTSLTIAMWLRTTDYGNAGTPLSYSVLDGGKVQDNALVLQDYNALVLTINNKTEYLDVDAADGKWHHLAVTWHGPSGNWITYLDGILKTKSDSSFQAGQVIKGGGVMVMGQEQDSLGEGFNAEEAFVGDISALHVWDSVLAGDEIFNLAYTCEHVSGNVVSWADFRENFNGMFTLKSPTVACDYTSAERPYLATINKYYSGINNKKTLSNVQPGQCASACSKETSFQCRSFNYDKNSKTCYLGTGNKHLHQSLLRQSSDERYDLYESGCQHALGLEDKTIPDSAMSASSKMSSLSSAAHGRLYNNKAHQVAGVPDSEGAWIAAVSNTAQWLQIDLGNPKYVRGIATQGRPESNDWVKTFYLRYLLSSWANTGTITGNSDSSTVVHRLVSFTARTVRVIPKTWSGRIAMRVELYGCDEGTEGVPQVPSNTGNPCSTASCKNGGRCISLYNDYFCVCPYGFTGKNCDTGMSCRSPDAPVYGFVSSVTPGIFTYSCKQGYRLSGPKTITCQNGQWSVQQFPTCEDENECSTIRPCHHTCINTKGSYKCSCHPGYKLSADGRSCYDVDECLNTGMCSQSCYNRLGSYLCSCLSGMTKTGRVCKDTNECATNNGECDQKCVNTYRGKQCKCNAGYKLASDGKTCNRITCTALSAPASGRIVHNEGNVLDSTVKFACNAGYRLTGSSTRVCNIDAQWSGKQPRCVRIYCPEVGSVPYATKSKHGYQNNGAVVGSYVVFTCASNYLRDGDQRRTCQSNGQWSGQNPRCVRADCPRLQAPAHGTVEGFRFEIGATLRISCDEGYEVIGDAFRTCQYSANGPQWSGQEPTCQLVDCGNPGSIVNGSSSFTSTKYQGVVTYSCQPSNHLEGAKTRVCQGDGEWSDEEPVCLYRSCGDPGTPANGKKLGNKYKYHESVLFQCNEGYNLVGSSTRICQTTGQWSGTQPQCQIVSCGDPGLFKNGQRFGDEFTYGSVVLFDCDPGYKLQGSIYRKCQADGQWTGSTASCVPTSCGAFRHGPSGVISTSNYPNNYNNDQYCTWEISVPEGKKVNIKFTSFQLQENDYLLIYNTGASKAMLTYTGTQTPPPVTSSGNKMRIRFISDNAGALKGFSLNYKQTNCGGSFEGGEGLIQSPEFPDVYPPNLECIWFINIPGQKVELLFAEFKTEDTFDSLEVYATKYWDSVNTRQINWSGRLVPQPVITNQFMWLRFRSNAQNANGLVNTGFSAKFRRHQMYEM